MNIVKQADSGPWEPALPTNRGLYYGGAWHDPVTGSYAPTFDPGRGTTLCDVAESTAEDIDKAVEAARAGFLVWRDTPPLERARILKEIARILRDNARELATIDAANCGNPVAEMMGDARIAAAQTEFFAGLVTEIKGATIPMGPDALNYSIRQPLGVVARIVAFNHPFMFVAGQNTTAGQMTFPDDGLEPSFARRCFKIQVVLLAVMTFVAIWAGVVRRK